jgi:Xaa-Pro aminopeptidase
MTRVRPVAATLVLLALALVPLSGQRTGYPAEEFAARRQRLAAGLERGLVVMFSATVEAAGVNFRQDNDFYYLTGSEDLNAVMVMEVPSGATHVYVPRLPAGTVLFQGGNWLNDADSARKRGVASVQPISALEDFLAARRAEGLTSVWARLGHPDMVDRGRYEVGFDESARRRNPLAQHPTEDAQLVQALRERFPSAEVKDITPHIDRLRLIKSPREIEILRTIGRISAEAMARAIAISEPGKYEYEFQAEAKYWLVKNGAQADAYAAIVGSGPNGNQWHYMDNGRRTERGDLVVMDYAGSLDYLTVDVTRTWPVSGRFTDEQRRAYECVLDAQLAMIAMMRHGATRQTIQNAGERVFRERGFDPRYAYSGHYVGLSVHDGGDWDLPLQAGMVLAIEPMIDLPDRKMHIRVEDTVVITQDGADVLTRAAPKLVPELLRLATTRER